MLALRPVSGYSAGRVRGPWFRGHPTAASAVIGVSAAAVLSLQFLDTRASDAIALLWVLPVSLAAVSYGLWGGVTTAAGAYLSMALFALWAAGDHLQADGWLSRAVAMFLLGGLLGRACDQTGRAGEQALEHLRQKVVAEDQNRRFSEGIELSDTILQHVAAAKWAVEQGDLDEAERLLTRVLGAGQEMVAELLPVRSSSPPLDGHPVRAVSGPEVR